MLWIFVATAASVSAALVFLFVVRRKWSPAKLRQSNDATAFYIAVACTVYAVILAFMLTSVWADFQDAKINAEQEANALVNVFRLASTFPDSQKSEIQESARLYARAIVGEEWHAMRRGEVSRQSAECVERLWRGVTRVEAGGQSDQAARQQALAGLAKMTDHRRVRQLQSRFRLPTILWLVLVFGGVATIATSCLIGIEDVRLHALHIVSLTCLVTLVLAAVAEIDRPFQGAVSVASESFEMALAIFDQALGK